MQIPAFEYEIVSALKKDSQEITDKDRQKLLALCRESDADKIVITHGTDTMIETAKVLSVLHNKTIALTGAMRQNASPTPTQILTSERRSQLLVLHRQEFTSRCTALLLPGIKAVAIWKPVSFTTKPGSTDEVGVVSVA